MSEDNRQPVIGTDDNLVLGAKAMFEQGKGLNSENHFGKTTQHNEQHLGHAKASKPTQVQAFKAREKTGEGLQTAEGVDPALWKTVGPKKGKRLSAELGSFFAEKIGEATPKDMRAEVMAEKAAEEN